MTLNAAIARARAHSPFLAMQLDLLPQVAEKIGEGDLAAALAAAASEDQDVMASVRRERAGHARALGIADLAGIIPLDQLVVSLSDLADRLIGRALAAAVAERTLGEA